MKYSQCSDKPRQRVIDKSCTPVCLLNSSSYLSMVQCRRAIRVDELKQRAKRRSFTIRNVNVSVSAVIECSNDDDSRHERASNFLCILRLLFNASGRPFCSESSRFVELNAFQREGAHTTSLCFESYFVAREFAKCNLNRVVLRLHSCRRIYGCVNVWSDDFDFD